MQQPHDILGIDRDANLEAIRQAYRKLARTAHPDAGGSKEDFVRLQSAYDAMTKACTSPKPLPAGQHRSAAQYPDTGSEWKSYADIMSAVRDRLARDERRRPLARHGWQSRYTRDFCLAIVLTPICAGIVSTSLCYDGQSVDQALWSFSFAITLAVLAYVCGLAAVVGASPVTSSLTVYRRMIVLVLIVIAFPLLQQPRPTSSKRHNTVFSRELVPDWWPISSRRSSHDE